MIRTENLVIAPASLLVVLLAKPSRLVIPWKKLEPIFAIQIASKLLLLLVFRFNGSIFSIAALLITCSITSTIASIALKSTINIIIVIVTLASGNGSFKYRSISSTKIIGSVINCANNTPPIIKTK